MDIRNTSNDSSLMRVQTVKDTFDFDIDNNIYIVRADRKLKPTRFLGLYKDKSVKAVGTIMAHITAIMTDDDIEYEWKFGKLTGKRINFIENFLTEHHLRNDKHSFFFIDNFYKTDFKKTSSGGLRRSKIIDLTKYLGKKDIQNAETLAEQLKNITWE